MHEWAKIRCWQVVFLLEVLGEDPHPSFFQCVVNNKTLVWGLAAFARSIFESPPRLTSSAAYFFPISLLITLGPPRQSRILHL